MKSKLPLTFGALVAILIGVLVALGAFSTAAPVVSPSPAAATKLPTTIPTTVVSPATSPRFDNAVLGYSISLPAAYRLHTSSINAGHPEQLGTDAFSVRTAAEERSDCLSSESPSIGSVLKHEFVTVAVVANVRGLSALRWAAGSTYADRMHTVEAVTVGGHEAARLVQWGIADAYVISANGRIYVLSHLNSTSSQRLADIVATFRALPPSPFPTAPPAQIARDAASDLGQRLALAFTAKDANAIAGLMSDCRISAGENIGGSPIGTEGISRSSAAFISALRDRFAQGDLTVTVNPTIQVHADTGQFFVRSEWKEQDRTTPIDLFLREVDGRWQWTSAIHYYPSLVGSGCIPYRSPWTASSC